MAAGEKTKIKDTPAVASVDNAALEAPSVAKTSPNFEENFPIVGLGASAGGARCF